MSEGDEPGQGLSDYNSWTKEELIDKVKKLEIDVQQLRDVISKKKEEEESQPRKKPKLDGENSNKDEDVNGSNERGRKKKVPRPFDFSRVTVRHVALKILYLGWDYQGLSVQEDTNETIEAHLFKALTLTRLIEDRSKSNYHRCGRTDKGVSAFSQVISIDLRSKVVEGVETLDYCTMLNRTLPKEIRVIGWSSVNPDFSARFNCSRRTYKYFFPKGDLDIEKMRAGAQYLIGVHDFRNFCKLDKDNRPTIRNIMSVDVVESCAEGNEGSPYTMCHVEITAGSFIWHQIRCIVGILILVGKGLEEPETVKDLLDLKKYPKKPQYTMAVDYPLVLYDVEYPESEGLNWIHPSANMTFLLSDLQSLWIQYATKARMIGEMLKNVEQLTEIKDETSMTEELVMGTKRKVYLKLKDRPGCASY